MIIIIYECKGNEAQEKEYNKLRNWLCYYMQISIVLPLKFVRRKTVAFFIKFYTAFQSS